MNTTRVLSTRVSMDFYFKVLDYAKLENMNIADYLLTSMNGYERYKREIDRSLSDILIKQGIDVKGMTIEEKNTELNVLINRIEEENKRLKPIVDKLMDTTIEKLEMELAYYDEPKTSIKRNRIRVIKKLKP